MRPITRIKSRTMSKALRKWIEGRLMSLGWHRSKSEKSSRGARWRGPGKMWISPRGINVDPRCPPRNCKECGAYKSLLSAALGAGIRVVPAI